MSLVFERDRGSGKTDRGGVGEGLPDVFGKPIADIPCRLIDVRLKALVAAVRLVGNKDDVAPF